MEQFKCARCGSHSFRYLRKKRASYCLKCGLEVVIE